MLFVRKWNLSNSPTDSIHSSAKYYIAGEEGAYPVTNFMQMEDISFVK